MSRPLRHHTVPQFYLKRFSHDEKHFFVFDKANGRTYKANVGDVCVERDFHRFVDPEGIWDLARKPLDSVIFESNYFAFYETYYAPRLAAFIEHVQTQNRVTLEDKRSIVGFIVLQWLRSPVRRDRYEGMIRSARECAQYGIATTDPSDPSYQELLEALADLRKVGDEAGGKARHLLELLDFRRIDEMCEHIVSLNWIAYVNMSPLPLYTSDNPVTVVEYESGRILPQGDIMGESAHILFPLAPSFALCMMSGKVPPSWRAGRSLAVSANDVVAANHRQYIHAKRQLLVPYGDYAWATRFHERDATVCDSYFGEAY